MMVDAFFACGNAICSGKERKWLKETVNYVAIQYCKALSPLVKRGCEKVFLGLLLNRLLCYVMVSPLFVRIGAVSSNPSLWFSVSLERHFIPSFGWWSGTVTSDGRS